MVKPDPKGKFKVQTQNSETKVWEDAFQPETRFKTRGEAWDYIHQTSLLRIFGPEEVKVVEVGQ